MTVGYGGPQGDSVAEWEYLVNNQMLSLVDEAEKRVEALEIRVQFGAQSLPVFDVQINNDENEVHVNFKVAT